MKTIFCDIDGVLFEHPGNYDNIYKLNPKVLPDVHKKLQEWHMKGYYIVLTTARLPSLRGITEAQLEEGCIQYHQLVMGIGRGQRVVINDLKPNSNEPTAFAVNLVRNVGLSDVEI